MQILIVLNWTRNYTNTNFWTYCPDWANVYKNVKNRAESKEYDKIICINGSWGRSDHWTSFMPPVRNIKSNLLPIGPKWTVFEKTGISGIKTDHLKQFLRPLSPKVVHIVGFRTSLEVYSTVVDVCELGFRGYTIPNCITDLDESLHESGLHILRRHNFVTK